MIIVELTSVQYESLTLVVVALIGIVPSILAAKWSRSAKNNSAEAVQLSTDALYEVKTNGGMKSPDPTLKDHVKSMSGKVDDLAKRMDIMEGVLLEHVAYSTKISKLLQKNDKRVNRQNERRKRE